MSFQVYLPGRCTGFEMPPALPDLGKAPLVTSV